MDKFNIKERSNGLMDKIFDCYDKEEISFNACKQLTREIDRFVDDFVGSPFRVLKPTIERRCGKCFKKIPHTRCDLLFLYEYADLEDKEKFKSFASKTGSDITSFYQFMSRFYSFSWNVCDDCFKELIHNIFNDEKEEEEFILKMKNSDRADSIFYDVD